MNISSKIIVILIVLFSSPLFGEALTLDTATFEMGQYTLEVENPDGYEVGDLLDIYSSLEEIDGNAYYKGYVDTVVIAALGENELILETLWYGASKNLESGYFLIDSERNIETETPEVEKLNRESRQAATEDRKKRRGFKYTFFGGPVFDGESGFGVMIGNGFFIGQSYFGMSVSASANTFALDHIDVTYNYNFNAFNWLELYLGAGIAVNYEGLIDSRSYDYYDYYDYNDPDYIGVLIEGGARLITGTFIDATLWAKSYIYMTVDGNINPRFTLGLRADF